jgi:hypothetical protein
MAINNGAQGLQSLMTRDNRDNYLVDADRITKSNENVTNPMGRKATHAHPYHHHYPHHRHHHYRDYRTIVSNNRDFRAPCSNYVRVRFIISALK